MVIALAGRRVDAPGAPPRFPPENEAMVRERIDRMLEETKADTLVCSAACGADIIALEAAAARGLRHIAVLPFAGPVFRETSVVDRPGDWGKRYDKVLETAQVRELGHEPGNDEAYAETNRIILSEAERLSDRITAVIVWNGESRGPGDLTAALADEARLRGYKVIEILTI